MKVDYVTPFTYTVKEISFFEWASALAAYGSKK